MPAASQMHPPATSAPEPGLDTGDKGESDPDPHLGGCPGLVGEACWTRTVLTQRTARGGWGVCLGRAGVTTADSPQGMVGMQQPQLQAQLTSCVTLGKFLHLSVPHLPPGKMRLA